MPASFRPSAKSRPMRGDGLRISNASRRPMAREAGYTFTSSTGGEVRLTPSSLTCGPCRGRAARGIRRAPGLQLRGRRVRRKTVARLEAGHLATFLIHGDKKRMPAEAPRSAAVSRFHLRRIADIARELGVARIPFEQDHPAQVAGLNISKDSSAFLRLLPLKPTATSARPFSSTEGQQTRQHLPKAQEKAARTKRPIHARNRNNSKTRVQRGNILLSSEFTPEKRPAVRALAVTISPWNLQKAFGSVSPGFFEGAASTVYSSGDSSYVSGSSRHRTVGIPRPQLRECWYK